MYKCLDCGYIFADGEQSAWVEAHGFHDGKVEHWQGCPVCHGGFAETEPCVICGEECFEDELYFGTCLSCLRKTMTYDDALNYLMEAQLLGRFMFEAWFESDVPDKMSGKLVFALREWFLRMKADDLLLKKTELLDACRKFILDDDGECGRISYAEFMKGVKK